MKLIDDFYRIEWKRESEIYVEYSLSLNKNHWIFDVHFPGNPIMPGVCIIQCCRELMEEHTGKFFMLKKIQHIKFLSTITPRHYEIIQVAFTKISDVEDDCKFSASVYRESTQFAKLSMHLQRK
jgi:3-hydroxyacyl-[acyl-carrier-protein] dehydratase